MNMEERYIVFKKSDVAKLAPAAQAQLMRLANAVDYIRELRGARPIRSVVVEHDWPEYERTVHSILFRTTGERIPAWFVVGSWVFAAAGLACFGYALS